MRKGRPHRMTPALRDTWVLMGAMMLQPPRRNSSLLIKHTKITPPVRNVLIRHWELESWAPMKSKKPKRSKRP
jgi:hypothetical protein